MIDRTSFENIKISIKLPNSTDDGYYRLGGSVDGHAVSSSAVCRNLNYNSAWIGKPKAQATISSSPSRERVSLDKL